MNNYIEKKHFLEAIKHQYDLCEKDRKNLEKDQEKHDEWLQSKSMAVAYSWVIFQVEKGYLDGVQPAKEAE